ncbi:MAG: DUF4328 domain-containing protein, partial [Armatimonadetes bacterium]|nr:DUF4328 domain-containing protein [Armatimonadota bacterium]
MTTPYASGRVLVWTVVAFLILAMLLHLGGLISDFQLIGVHAGQKGLYRLDIGRRDLYLVFSAATLLAALGTYALASIALVAWLRNSYRNLVALGGTPRYAMWWPLAAFFVPFVNVLRPYEMVTEICANARPLMRGNAKPVPPLVPWWWAVTLLAGLAWLAWLYGALAFGNRVGVIEVRVLAGLLTLVSAALTVSIVQTISQMQDDSWEGRFLPAPAQEGRWRHL